MIGNEISKKQQILIGFFSVLFLVMPTKSFLGISGDLIQISLILGTATLAFMTIVVSIDHSFGLKGLDPEKIGNVISSYSKNLIKSFSILVSFIISSVVVKALCLWFIDVHIIFLDFIDHFLAMFIGGFFIRTLSQFENIVNMFGFMAIGAEISSMVRATFKK